MTNTGDVQIINAAIEQEGHSALASLVQEAEQRASFGRIGVEFAVEKGRITNLKEVRIVSRKPTT